IGPMTRKVTDNARVLEVLAGHDKRDSTSSKQAVPSFTDTIHEDIKGLRIAVPKQFLGEGVSEEIKESVQNAIQMFELLVDTLEIFNIHQLYYANSAYYIIANGEASSSLARYDGVSYGHRSDNATNMIDMLKQSRVEGFGEEVKRRILLVTTVLSGDYNETYFRKAQQVRTLIANDFRAA